MKEIIFKEDLKFMYVTARSFPKDVFQAHQELHSRLGIKDGRHYFGISFIEGNVKVKYIAAATEKFADEGATLNLKTASLKKGIYHFISFPHNPENSIENGEAFRILILTSKSVLQVAENIKEEPSFL